MRVAIVHWSAHFEGGAEAWVEGVLRALHERGVELMVVWEARRESARRRMSLPEGTRSVVAGDAGIAETLRALTEFGPDVLYFNGMRDPEVEEALLDVAPSVASNHAFVTCITGRKFHQFPEPAPCDKVFGPACFAHYYPRRCGGLNPLRMIDEYGVMKRRVALLRRHDQVVVHSEFMVREHERHGVPSAMLPYPPLVFPPETRRWGAARLGYRDARERQLLLLGRVDRNKGGSTLIHALPRVAHTLGARVVLHVAGEGQDLPRWKAEAATVMRRDSLVTVLFHGWVGPTEKAGLFGATDLLVLPSVWPEPFGLVGLEGAMNGLPAVAFDVGAVREWLCHGESGMIAEGRGEAALAEAISVALRTEETLGRLSRGAVARARQMIEADGVGPLFGVFERAISTSR